MLPIIPFYALIYITHSISSYITKDDVIPSYLMNIIVNITYLSTVIIQNFEPTQYTANIVMSMLIAFYIYDTQKVLLGKFSSKDKLIYVPHHVITLFLLMGQLYNMYPLKIGMWYLTLFEFSNFFLQFFQVFNKKKMITARNMVSLPLVLTYVPIRGFVIPVYSLEFVPYVMRMNTIPMLLFSFLFTFVNVFSIYFAWIILEKFMAHYKTIQIKDTIKLNHNR